MLSATKGKHASVRRVSRLGFFSILTSVLSLLCTIACEGEVSYTTQEVVVNINSCIEALHFERDDGCAAYYQASSEGCFVLSDDRGTTQTFPIVIDETGLSALNGEDDLISALSLTEEREAKMSIYLYSSDHMNAPRRCDALSIDSACDGECVIAIREQALDVIQQANLLKITTSECQWTPANQELVELLCDQVDNDCDGNIDENEAEPSAPREGEPCSAGLGLCQVDGLIECLDGVGQAPRCSAVALQASGQELCDDLDNDCDGAIDEGFGVNEPCIEYEGTACQVEGTLRCESSSEEDPNIGGGVFCDLGERDPLLMRVERESGLECDGVDNDCDFTVDEHFTPQVVDCGIGSCSEQAVTTCIDGTLDNACRVGEPSGDDATCDNIDDDCDGKVDEGFEINFITCGLGVCGSNGPILCSGGSLNNLCMERSPQGDDSDCDGIDDDCDGRFDEAYQVEEVSCGVGACRRTGTKRCVDSQITTTCEAGVPANDLCDGIDNDCDGAIDERFNSEVTSCGAGFCQSTGSTYCNLGEIRDSCTPGLIANSNDLCDGIDSDCDGRVDEDHVETLTSCGVGACSRNGRLQCINGALIDNCSAFPPANGDVDSTCDAVDSDCDGRADEGFEGESISCGFGSCAATGFRTCINGDSSGTTCVIGQAGASDESCDGVDQDCDQSVDEDYQGNASTCGLGACRRTGFTSCENGNENPNCIPGQPVGNDASCDGIDADCDGRFDEGYQSSVTSCGLGVCQRNGQRLCQNGQVTNTCIAGSPTTADNQCDQLDNDCDGLVDEGYVSTVTYCGVGVCANQGNRICTPLGLVNTCAEQAPIDSDWRCDGLDADCDGLVDEAYTSRQISCGIGACIGNGQTVCSQGDVLNICQEEAPNGLDDDCDLVDNDCDGKIDESYDPADHEVTCQNNACTGVGNIICTNVGPVNTCVVDDGQLVDDSCDGVDQDCDGAVDEHYQPPSGGSLISCGVGACLNEAGVLACDEGSVITLCTSNNPIGDDSNCDNIDDDCDGSVDEAFNESSSCGVGSCARTALDSCVNGQRINNCVAGDPEDHDRCGNQTDDDCDGSIFDYGLQQSCTVTFQACTNTGVNQCNATLDGVACSAGIPQPEIESCDGLDNDCDSFIDEEVSYAQPSCESNAQGIFGLCRQGTLSCQNGADYCQPSQAQVEDSCSGEDEDCDGFVDEERINNQVRRLGASCGNGTCRWRCSAGDSQLTCRRDNGNQCN